jgi:N-acetylglucosaminyldiphosphoundecaprenol N-acetyl-beta-D-mannosaminyltransferase
MRSAGAATRSTRTDLADDTTVVDVLGVPFRHMSPELLVSDIESRIRSRRGGYVCCVCASSLIEASRDDEFMTALREADINLPDGAPVAWAVSRFLGRRQERMPGPTVMLHVLKTAAASGWRVALYGSTLAVQDELVRRLRREYPALQVAATISPPFRELTPKEESDVLHDLRASRPDILLVSLGAPRQEKWMHGHRSQMDCTIIGVGAAFEYNAGLIKRAPPVMQVLGLEWLSRLVQQPRRVGRRLLTTLPFFVLRLLPRLVRPPNRSKFQ